MGSTYCNRPGSVAGLVLLSLVLATEATAQSGAAIDLAGNQSYVVVSPSTGLGASTFTLELWFKREGPGKTVGTGSGGVTAVPLITKGRSESDGTQTDVNYFLGIDPLTNRLVVDFEQDVTGSKPGKNHPVSSSTVIVNDRWYHAAATYDGVTWRLYLNGALDTQLTVNEPPRADSIQPVGIGSALNSGGVPNGFFDGIIDEVRIWNGARTAQQIQETMNLEVASAPGLLGRWGFNEGTGTTIADTAGGNKTGALITSPYYSWTTGAPFRSNQLPSAVLTAPANGATGVSTSPSLQASVSDADGDPLTVTFYGGPTPAVPGPDFTIAVIPDTQHYVIDQALAQTFTAQTQWIVDNQVSKNIVFVTHLGDVVDNKDLNQIEWTRADASLSVLEAGNMKWGLSPGNHDMSSSGVATYYDLYFPVSRFEGYPWYGGYLGKDPADPVNRQNKNSYQLFSASGLDFIVIHLEYDVPGYSVAWADRILKQHPNRRAILSTHLFLHNSGARSNAVWDRPDGTSAEGLWQQLIRTNCNVFLVLSGHYDGEANRTTRSASPVATAGCGT
jgi:hypothetical protein